MNHTKRVDLLVKVGVVILLCIMGREVVANEFEVVNKASTISENERLLINFNESTDSFIHARNMQCNNKETKELLTKSKREKIMVTVKD